MCSSVADKIEVGGLGGELVVVLMKGIGYSLGEVLIA